MIIINSLKCKKFRIFGNDTNKSDLRCKADNIRWTLSVIHLNIFLYLSSSYQRGRDGVVGIAAGYKPYGFWFEPRGEWVFSHLLIPAPRSTQPPAQWLPALFPGDKAPGAWR